MARAAARATRPVENPRRATPRRSGRTVATRTASDRRAQSARATRTAVKPAGKPTGTTNPKRVQPRRSRSPIARAVTHRDASSSSRRMVKIGSGVLFVIVAIMMIVVVAQTRIAENQMNIDRIEDDISAERDRYNTLRLERSTLREPARLVIEARALGMQPGVGIDFTSVEPMTVAAVLVATGGVDPELLAESDDPLREYGEFKSILGGRP